VDSAGAAQTASVNATNAPKDLSYWQASAGGASITWSSMSPPSWLQTASGNVRVMSSSTAVSDKWYQVEMRLPVSANPANGLVLPASGDFRMYVNTIRYQPDPANPGGYITPEVYWPQSAPLTVGDVNNTPAPNTWGLASLAGPCSGVHITDARTNNSPTNSVNVNSTNNISTVDIKNSGSDAAGPVRAELKNSRFGLPGPGLWGTVPWPGNPMTTPSGIAAGQTVSVSTGAWDLVNDPNRQQYINDSSLCSRIELTPASGATTLISYPVFYKNMHFSTASKFEHRAILDATGYRRRADGRPQQFVLNVFTANDLPAAAVATERMAVSARAVEMRQIAASLRQEAFQLNAGQYVEKGAKFFRKYVCGYRRTGEFITIKGTKAEVVEPANCYGYLLAHEGRIAEWRDQPLKADGLRQAALPGVRGARPLYQAYQAELRPGQSIQLATEVATAETTAEPGQPDRTKCSCGDFKCMMDQSRTSDSGAIQIAGLLMVGGLGVGGVAFVRRRKRKE
jgi:hypothetical protein